MAKSAGAGTQLSQKNKETFGEETVCGYLETNSINYGYCFSVVEDLRMIDRYFLFLHQDSNNKSIFVKLIN